MVSTAITLLRAGGHAVQKTYSHPWIQIQIQSVLSDQGTLRQPQGEELREVDGGETGRGAGNSPRLCPNAEH